MLEQLINSGAENLSFPIGPGPTELIGYAKGVGFFGEFSSEDFISGSELASEVGLSSGTSINSDTNWLKFFLDGKILYIPKLTIRHQLTWRHLYQAGLVYGNDTIGLYPNGGEYIQNTKVTIAGYTFIVRCPKGADNDPTPSSSYGVANPSHSQNSEWSRLFYPICIDSPSSYTGEKWANYTHSDLFPNTSGEMNFCQESVSGSTTYNLRRGRSTGKSQNVFWYLTDSKTSSSIGRGWRPVLELIP